MLPMHGSKVLSVLLVFVLLMGGSLAWGADPAAAPKPKTFAIFVANHASKEVDDAEVDEMEDLIIARVNDGKVFRAFSREDLINSVNAFSKKGPNAGNDRLPGAELDELLSNNTSLIGLVRSMNADYGLKVSITSYDHEAKPVDIDNVHLIATNFELVCTYKIINGATGETISSDDATVNKKVQVQRGDPPAADPINSLLKEAAAKLADSIREKVNGADMAVAPAPVAKAGFFVEVEMADLQIPEVTKDPASGEYKVTQQTCKLDLMSATVEIDGIAQSSTTPGPFTATPGIHKFRISRDGCQDYIKTLAVADGGHMRVAMQLTPEGNARWKGNVAFLEQMKNNAKLTDADVKRIEGMAKMFEQSGFKVDYKADIKVDKKTDMKINSIWPDPADQTATPAGTTATPGTPATPVPGH